MKEFLQESRAVAGQPRYAAVNFKRYEVCTQLFVSLATLVAVDMAAKIEYNK